jgi:CheY-like chemotaxis protein
MGSETLLLVEDEENVRRPMAEILEDAGYLVLSAADGVEAARLAERRAGAIDLLVTDVILPGMSGQELAVLLAERRPEMRVLFTTGYPDELVEGFKLPGGRPARLLKKPFTGHALTVAIRELLAR